MIVMAPNTQFPQALPYHLRYYGQNQPQPYFESQEPQRGNPVIKKEPLSHSYTPFPPTRNEYSGKTHPGEGTLSYDLAIANQGFHGWLNPCRSRTGRAESSVIQSQAHEYYLGTNGTVHPSQAEGHTQRNAHSSQQFTNTGDSRSRLTSAGVAVQLRSQRQSQPENFSGSNNQESHKQRLTYEAPRHTSAAPYQTVVAFPQDPNPVYYPYHPSTMSLSYETRAFPDYPQSAMMHDPHQEQEDSMHQHRYPSPPPPINENQYNPQALDAATALALDEMADLPPKEESDPPSPGRSKPIPKPDREVTKGEDGRFVCSWAGCTEDVRSFNRKCEWSKHMDKHDRPYKCPADGCEKLPGFTYSGGLLRHQREVHNLHGGPRKQLNCPHPNCKRFSGKGFSRQENLNEHLRRVHTDAGDLPAEEETEEDGSERAGMKRKRVSVRTDENTDVRAEMARIRMENEELRRQNQLQKLQTDQLMQQVQTLQALVAGKYQSHAAPQANMM